VKFFEINSGVYFCLVQQIQLYHTMNNTGHWKEHYLVYQTFLSIGVNLKYQRYRIKFRNIECLQKTNPEICRNK
jgi:hypothetical protein